MMSNSIGKNTNRIKRAFIEFSLSIYILISSIIVLWLSSECADSINNNAPRDEAMGVDLELAGISALHIGARQTMSVCPIESYFRFGCRVG